MAEVVEWQTRTFEGRVAQAVRVQVPPSAPTFLNPIAAVSGVAQASQPQSTDSVADDGWSAFGKEPGLGHYRIPATVAGDSVAGGHTDSVCRLSG